LESFIRRKDDEMIRPTGRLRMLLVGAGFLAVVAVAAFLILDLGGGSVTASDLPVIQFSQATGSADEAQLPSTTSSASTVEQLQTDPTTTSVSTASSGSGLSVASAGSATITTSVPVAGKTTSTSELTSPDAHTDTTYRETVNGDVRIGPGQTGGQNGGQNGSQGPGGGSSGPSGQW
jgi:hypothetical protein